jgi:Zn-dependent metalloprotease
MPYMSPTPKLLTFAVSMALAGAAAAANPVADHARQLVRQNPAAVHAAAADEFVERDVIRDPSGAEHVRFQRTYAGLDVIGGDFVVHSSRGALRGVSKTLTTSFRPNTRPSLGSDAAIAIAGADFGTDFIGVPTSRLVVFALNTRPTLAHEVVFMGQKANGDPTEMHFFVDAHGGRILDKWDMVHTAKPGGGGGTGGGTAAVGTGRTLMYGNVSLNTAQSGSSFNMTDTTRGGGAVYDANQISYSTAASRATLFVDADNTWGNNTTSDRATVAADAHFGVSKTWDFYKNTFGRNGIWNDGRGVKSYVHVGRSWVNAAWYAGAMYYGDAGGSYLPLVSLDIAGHEMSHGVNQATANLAYSNDSGGLNEANSDIMGTLVEFYAAHPNDPGDYRIGEKIYVNGTSSLRFMYDPNLDGNLSYDCYPAGGLGGVDPHYSSGPANHLFYLLAEGTNPSNGMPASKTCNPGDTKNATGTGTLAGIGRDKAGALWHRAHTVYMTSGTTFPQARAAMLNAATDLYGAASAERAAVAAAWSAIGVN